MPVIFPVAKGLNHDFSGPDRALAFANIQKAAQHYGVDLSETDWHQLGLADC